MIVCSCNLLSDRAVRSTVEAERTHSISRIYSCLGCRARCGYYAPTFRRIIDEMFVGKAHPVTNQGGQGVGTLLVRNLLDGASRSFSAVRLFTDTKDGAMFYEALGFVPSLSSQDPGRLRESCRS